MFVWGRGEIRGWGKGRGGILGAEQASLKQEKEKITSLEKNDKQVFPFLSFQHI